MLEVLRLRMKNRTKNYGRYFCGNVEMECIVNSALSGWTQYWVQTPNKQAKRSKKCHFGELFSNKCGPGRILGYPTGV